MEAHTRSRGGAEGERAADSQLSVEPDEGLDRRTLSPFQECDVNRLSHPGAPVHFS